MNTENYLLAVDFSVDQVVQESEKARDTEIHKDDECEDCNTDRKAPVEKAVPVVRLGPGSDTVNKNIYKIKGSVCKRKRRAVEGVLERDLFFSPDDKEFRHRKKRNDQVKVEISPFIEVKVRIEGLKECRDDQKCKSDCGCSHHLEDYRKPLPQKEKAYPYRRNDPAENIRKDREELQIGKSRRHKSGGAFGIGEHHDRSDDRCYHNEHIECYLDIFSSVF